MVRKIRKAAVLGAGTMGASIAAHLANVGIPCYLLDIVLPEPSEGEKAKGITREDKAFRNKLAAGGIENLKKMRPAPLYDSKDAALLTPGNLEDDLKVISEVDWVIEVVVERMDIKKQLLEKLEAFWKPGTIVSTNTSGLSVNEMVADRSPGFKKHFLGTHFFNPPRYMKLLEVIPGKETDPEIVEFLKGFGDEVLGKGVVLAKDTPNFIANRIGVYGFMRTVEYMEREELSVAEVDALTGPAMGRPRAATFRTLDMVGLDILLHVAGNVKDFVTEDWEVKAFEIPPFLTDMVERKWLGEKTKQGFYKVDKSQGKKDILALDYRTMEYKPKEKAKFACLEASKKAGSKAASIKALVESEDRGGRFAWQVTRDVLNYTALKLDEIAGDIVAVDNALRWGFNWELGPFQTWDAIGVKNMAERMAGEGVEVPPLVQKLLDAGFDSFYKKEKGQIYFFDHRQGEYRLQEPLTGVIYLPDLKEEGKVVLSNSGASLVDIGDGVACFEIHSPHQALGADVMILLNKAVEEVEKNWQGMVIANHARNFCVGANLMMVLMEAQAEEWDEIDMLIRQFQTILMRMKYSEKPVVAAPHSLVLGGGYEVIAHADAVMAAAETYMGLVELGVGVIPAGGGTKEMVLRSTGHVMDNEEADLLPFIKEAFMVVGQAKVATSAKEAVVFGYMRPTDGFAANGDRRIDEAKKRVLAMMATGYKPPVQRKIRVIGETGLAALKAGVYMMKEGKYISEYDAYLGEKLAYIMAGGLVPANTWVTEQHLLDLEREVFVHLCGQPKTQARMAHMLKTGKPLRN